MSELWGIDLGGTKIEGVVLRGSVQPQVVTRIRIATESHLGFDHIIGRVKELVVRMQGETGLQPRCIGFGTPGVLDPQSKTMKNCNTTCLNGRPLQAELEKVLGVKTILANDANCFALAENKFGASQGAHSSFGIIMGTGVGGGIVVNEQVLYGCQGIAGEWGHNVLDPEGHACYCGKTGCVETVISGPALERYYQQKTGISKNLHEIADSQDLASQETLRHLYASFGKALSVVINIIDPEVVVLGGGVSNIKGLYAEGIEELRQNVFNNSLHTKVVPNKLGDSGGVFGAALLSVY